jgi:ABC-type antimicrobial peptide transport system permease subunit
VLGQGVRLAGAGLALGLVAALPLARLMAALLYGIHVYDPLTFAGVPVLLGAVALAACWIPARRAAGVEPIEALRYE